MPLAKKKQELPHASKDEKYYDAHKNRAIPTSVVQRIVFSILNEIAGNGKADKEEDGDGKQKKKRISKKAMAILHKEAEKYTVDIFKNAGTLAQLCARSTVLPHFMKNAVEIRNVMIRSLKEG
jgi:histone H3/H4